MCSNSDDIAKTQTFSMVRILVVLVIVVGVVSPVERVSLGIVGDQAEPRHDDGGAHGEGRHHHEHLRRRMNDRLLELAGSRNLV